MTERMIAVLRILAASPYQLTPNQIARGLGFQTGQDAGRHSRNGRAMGPALRVIFPLNRLTAAKLVRLTGRRDGLSGSAYEITEAGRKAVAELKANGATS